jgi:hypothetical protein
MRKLMILKNSQNTNSAVFYSESVIQSKMGRLRLIPPTWTKKLTDSHIEHPSKHMEKHRDNF